MIKINNEVINVTMFPDKSSQVWKIKCLEQNHKKFDIIWNFEHEGELFHLVQLVDLIRVGRVPVPINLHMPYLPYGRQDKPVSNNLTFALSSFCKILNTLNLDSITCLDAHSDFAKDVLHGFRNICPRDIIRKVMLLTFPTTLAFPDKGAFEKYNYMTSGSMSYAPIAGEKIRDQESGNIESYEISRVCEGEDVLVVDDLADAGGTFILLTKKLLAGGAKTVNLYVTHGLFSKGVKVLFDSGISRIFTSKGEIFPSKDTNYLIKEF